MSGKNRHAARHWTIRILARVSSPSDDSHHLWGRLVGHTVLCGSFLSHRSSMQRIGPYDHPLASRCPAHDSRGAAGASFFARESGKRILRVGRWQGQVARIGNRAERIRVAVGCSRGGRDVRSPARAQAEEMTRRDIPSLLAILACVIAATVITWWLSMRAIEYFLPSWG